MRKTDLRRRSRHSLIGWKAAVVFDAAQNRPIIHAPVQDLSTIGASIHTESGDLTGAVVTLLLTYPARDDEKTRIFKMRARVVSSVHAPGMPHHRHGLSFIRTPHDAMDELEGILHAAQAAQREAADAEAKQDEIAGGSRLARLKRQANALRTQARAADAQDLINASVSDALGRSYRYLKDLVDQLNIIVPTFRKGYDVPGVPEFNRLTWDGGRADFHSREITPVLKLYDRVTLRFQLSGKKQLKVTREFPANQRLRQWLAECKIPFTEQDSYNARGAVDRTTFFFPAEVKASLVLHGQYETGKLLLRTSNVSGFGALDQILAPEAISEDSLDELAGFILGETPNLGPLLLRNA